MRGGSRGRAGALRSAGYTPTGPDANGGLPRKVIKCKVRARVYQLREGSAMTPRNDAYKVARFLGDYNAVASGNPNRIAKRFVNKLIGRVFVSKMWWR